MSAKTVWEPPSVISREEVVKLDREVAARPSSACTRLRRYLSHPISGAGLGYRYRDL